MDKIKMNHKMDKTFEEGFEEHVLGMKARNLRQGTKPLKKQYDETFVARDTLSKLKMYDNWGYATENFHANTGIVYTKT